MEVLLKAQYAAAQNKERKMSEAGHSWLPLQRERDGREELNNAAPFHVARTSFYQSL